MQRRLVLALLLLFLFIATCGLVASLPPLPHHRSLDELRHARHRTIDHIHVALSSDAGLVADPPEMWFSQTLDHFNNLDRRTFQQRYFVNRDFWSSSKGPVFLFIGGEGPLASKWVTTGLMYELAKKYGALLVAVEHRYYGKSVPVSDLSLPNMRWLSSQQALEDLANFQQTMAAMWNVDSKAKWICFGGSYPGNLSAWYRLKFPNLVAGAIAASAPVQATLDYYQYDVVMRQSLESAAGGQCATNLAAAITAIDGMLDTASGQQTLASKFKVCKPISDPDEFAYAMVDPPAGAVQYNNAPLYPMDAFCKQMQANGDPLSNLAASVVGSLNGAPCLDISVFAELRNTTVSLDNSRQWYFQKCTEFGYFKNSYASGGVVSWRVDADFHQRMCESAFPAVYPPNINMTNTVYGSTDIMRTGSNIFFSNGDYDQWHALSVLSSTNPNVQTCYYHGAAHCAPLYTAQPNDAPEVVQCRSKIDAFVGNILSSSS